MIKKIVLALALILSIVGFFSDQFLSEAVKKLFHLDSTNSTARDSANEERKVVARVRKLTGDVLLLRDSMRKVKLTDKIFAGDTIRTSENATLDLKMSSGHRIRIHPNSEVNLHIWMDKFTVYKHSGEVELTNSTGAVDQLVLADENSAHFIEENLEKPLNTKKVKRLKDTQILAAIRPHRPKMYRCYHKNVKKGSVSVEMNFHIEPNGRVKKAWIAHSTATNEAFKKCLIEVFKQAQFPSFSGSAIPTKYPMKFE